MMDIKENWRYWAFVFTIFGCVQYIVLTVLGMLFYPGGTYTDESTTGYSFFENYFSDIGRTVSHSNDPNTLGWLLFTIAMFVGGLAICAFFLAFYNFFQGTPRTKNVTLIGTIFGILAAIGFMGIGFVPADINVGVHRLFMYASFGCVLVVSLLFTLAMFWHEDYPRIYTYFYLIFTICAAFYMVLLFAGPSRESVEGLAIQAGGQKIIVYAMILNFLIQGYGAWNLERK
jgi:hypothetical protein